MRILKIMLIALVLGSVTVLSLNCASNSAPTLESQGVTVQRGDLTIDITGVGNLALSYKVDLAFEIDGTVQEVLVEEGESAKEGQLLAKLDTSAWEDQLSVLEDKVTAAERNVTAAERQVTVRQRDLLQAEINLKNAKIALYQASVLQWPGVELAQAELDRAKYSVEYAHQRLADAPENDKEHWSRLVAKAEEDLIKAENKLNLLLSGTPTDELAIKRLQVEMAQGKLDDAQAAIEDAQIGIEDAKKAVEDAKKALDEAMDASPEIKSPFTGFITKVNVSGGDEVKKGTVAVTLADPNKFEADILVNEMDILQIKLGGNASVQVDAMQGMSLPAKVTHISPTAIIQQGIVNYKVKVEVESLQPVTPLQPPASGNLSSDNISSGVPSGGSRRSFGGDNLTQEQIEQMIQQRQQARAGQPSGQQPQMPTRIPEDFQLREGLTVTVSLIVEQKSNVLLVPNAAIATKGRQAYVQVLKDGVIEERPVTVGISNWQYAEITNGVSEGEQVIVPKTATSTTPATTQQGQQGGFIPGIGRMTR